MKIIFAQRLILTLVLLGTSVSSPAVIVEGFFTGTVINTYDESNFNPGYSKFWSSTVSEQAVTGSFWYDTELAPSARETGDIADYSYDDQLSPPKWLDLTYNIDGKSLSIPDNYPESFNVIGNVKRVQLIDRDDPADLAYGNYLSLVSSTSAENSAGNLESSYAYLGIREPIIDIVKNLGLAQDFRWSRGGRGEWGMGGFATYGEKDNQPFYAWARMDIASLTVSPQAVSVPAPSSLYLLALGLFGLVLQHSRRISSYRPASFLRKLMANYSL